MDGESKIATKHINIKSKLYLYDLDNIPSIIKLGDKYELSNTCNITNTSKLSVGKHTIKCGDTSKDVEVVKNDKAYIDVNNIPSTIVVGTLYELPSHVYGNNIQYIKCFDEKNNLVFNTSTLSLGKHEITCILKTDNDVIRINKTINVIKPKYSFDIYK
jgi:hypothetical protein